MSYAASRPLLSVLKFNYNYHPTINMHDNNIVYVKIITKTYKYQDTLTLLRQST